VSTRVKPPPAVDKIRRRDIINAMPQHGDLIMNAAMKNTKLRIKLLILALLLLSGILYICINPGVL
jgi:hypothetical protein